MRWLSLTSISILVALAAEVAAGEPMDANWVWIDDGKDSADSAPIGKVWFRRVVRESAPCTGRVRIAGDEHFVLWVNGQRIGKGGGNRSFDYSLNGIVHRGINVIAVEASNEKGRAGLIVDGEIRNQGGKSTPFDTPDEWLATRVVPKDDSWLQPDFDASDWLPVEDLGRHEDSPWKAIRFDQGLFDHYQLPPGFEIIRIAEPELVGSLVAITWGNRGRLIASREKGPIQSIIDTDGDGLFDKIKKYSGQVTNCQGLCMVSDDLYAVGEGPQGTGLYRLPDRNQDDVADEVQHLFAYRGRMGEHGPHDVVLGPDGWLYNNLGNHAGVDRTPEKESPVRDQYEGDLLRPRFEDAGGHARGRKIPGGTIWRLTPDGSKWWLETAGFRNEYDFAFNGQGDLFTFDSDMEWDVGQPWYRPVRVNHCIPGAEFGWRSGAAKWPEYYVDSLPTTVDIGRGSPTGVVFYEHTAFPEKYRGSFLVCDWSMGRIIAVHPKPSGASFTGSWENLVTGNPLNVSDIEVDRDGSIVFSTGGRGTEGGIYRVRYTASNAKPFVAKTLEETLDAPQTSAAWLRQDVAKIKRQLASHWELAVVEKARNGTASQQVHALTFLCQLGPEPSTELLIELAGDEDASVRAFVAWLLGNRPEPEVEVVLTRLLEDQNVRVQRRACEAFVRSGLQGPKDQLVAMLGSSDRWLRFAARLALERLPTSEWRNDVLTAQSPRIKVNGLLALHRLGELSGPVALGHEFSLLKTDISPGLTIDVLRMIELSLLTESSGPDLERIGQLLLERFPTGNMAIDRESARILAVLEMPGAAGKIVDEIERNPSIEQQIHYALCLSYLDVGWNFELKRRLLDWYETTRDWDGGNSFVGNLQNIIGASLARFGTDDITSLLESWRDRPFATRVLLSRSTPEQIAGSNKVLADLVAEIEKHPAEFAELISAAVITALGRSGSPESQAILRKLYDELPDHREVLARILARHPSLQNREYLLGALGFGESVTLQECLRGLGKIDQKLEKPAEIRVVILAGLKLGEKANLAVELLNRKSPANFETKKARASLTHFQDWYHQTFPDQPSAELPKQDRSRTRHTFEQLSRLLEKSRRGRAADPVRGKQVFSKANCQKCHRFSGEGEGIGPDLSTIRRRFQRKEIIAALLYPSQVISDQYRSVSVATVDGLIYTGMPIPQSDSHTLVLLLSDATKIEIETKNIETQKPSAISVMPEGVLNNLSLQDIADLFAFLETSKNNPLPPKTQPGASSADLQK